MHTGLAAFKHRAKKDPLVVDLQPSPSHSLSLASPSTDPGSSCSQWRSSSAGSSTSSSRLS